MTPGSHNLRIVSAGRQRRCLVHVPQPTGNRPLPLVLVFHGSGTTGPFMVGFTGWSDKAEQEQFVVAYPTGTGITPAGNTWNAGGCCGDAFRQGVDDVGFVADLVEQLTKQLPIDHARIYAVGMSNGGMMCYELARKLDHQLAAIASVAGPMTGEAPGPKRPIPVIHFHGTLDEYTPYEGGIGRKSISKCFFRSAEETVAAWVAYNGCHLPPLVEKFSSADREDATWAERLHYRGVSPRSDTVLVKIHGMGHTWPGRRANFIPLGPSSFAVDATTMIWDFFRDHALAT